MPAKRTDKPKKELPKIEPTPEEWERFQRAVRKVAKAKPQTRGAPRKGTMKQREPFPPR